MGFELGFSTHEYDENRDFIKDIFWSWCGWENTDLYEALSELSNEGYTRACSDTECHIPIENLAFIETLYTRLYNNPHYVIYHKLLELEKDDFAQEYFNNLTIGQKAAFYLCFYFDDPKIIAFTRLLIEKIEYEGYFIVESLYKAYQKAKEMNLKEVILYRG